jgi:Ca2+-binding EF-hand superfamily protein
MSNMVYVTSKSTIDSSVNEEIITFDPEILKGLKDYSIQASKLKKVFLSIFVKTVKNRVIEHLRTQFELIDINNTGLIDKEELSKALKQANIDVNDEDIENIFKRVNIKGNGEINYCEFIAATMKV